MRTNRYAVGAALVAAGLLTGCGGGGNGGGTSHTALSASAKTPQGLTATFTEDRAAMAVGESVTYTFRLTNNTSQPITYRTQGGCGINREEEGAFVLVTDSTGARVYPDVLGGGCTAVAIGAPVTLAPGQSVSDIFSPPGGNGGTNPFTAPGPYHAAAKFIVIAADGDLNTTDPTLVGPLTVNVQ